MRTTTSFFALIAINCVARRRYAAVVRFTRIRAQFTGCPRRVRLIARVGAFRCRRPARGPTGARPGLAHRTTREVSCRGVMNATKLSFPFSCSRRVTLGSASIVAVVRAWCPPSVSSPVMRRQRRTLLTGSGRPSSRRGISHLRRVHLVLCCCDLFARVRPDTNEAGPYRLSSAGSRLRRGCIPFFARRQTDDGAGPALPTPLPTSAVPAHLTGPAVRGRLGAARRRDDCLRSSRAPMPDCGIVESFSLHFPRRSARCSSASSALHLSSSLNSVGVLMGHRAYA